MKAATGTLATILALSLLVWATFFALTPQAPLGSTETLVVVGLCAGLVLGARSVLARFRRSGDDRGGNP